MPFKLYAPGERGRNTYFVAKGRAEAWVGTDKLVREFERSTGEARRRDAERKAREIEASYVAALKADREANPTVGDLAVRYLDGEGDPTYLRPIILALGDERVTDLANERVAEAARAAYPRVAASTLDRQFYTPLFAMCRRGARGSWLPDDVERPKGRAGTARTKFARPKQASAIVEASRDKHFAVGFPALVTWLFGTGCRMGETILLTLPDLFLDDGFALLPDEVTKARRARRVDLLPRVATELRALPWIGEGDGPVFRSRYGTAYRSSRERSAAGHRGGGQIARPWARACTLAGLPDGHGITPHVARHSKGTWHYSAHKDVVATSRLLGHADLKMTDRYVQVSSDAIGDEAVAEGWAVR